MINRFEWFKAVLQSDLPDRAKALAGVWSTEFANDGTGQCNPSVLKMAKYLKWSHDKVKRALKELEAAGWMVVTIGNGRRKTSSYTLLSPGNVVVMRLTAAPARPITTEIAPAKGTQNGRRTSAPKVRRTAAKGTQNDAAHIRHEQTYEQKARADAPRERPSPHLTASVERGSAEAKAWDAWLWRKSLPALAELPALERGTAYDLPWTRPPTSDGDTMTMIAERIIEWAANHKTKGAKHDRAA